MQMLLLGQGNDNFESRLIALSENQRFAGRVCFMKGFSPDMANRIFAAGDFFIVPSRYEPCGLTDFIAQLFGNIPIVHHVGGLVKVKDGVTGISYQDNSPDGLVRGLEKAMVLDGDETLKRTIQQQGIEEIHKNYTWTKVMRKYLELYSETKKTQVCQ
jgi:starch synthase